MGIRHNISLAGLRRFAKIGGRLNFARENEQSATMIEQLAIKCIFVKNFRGITFFVSTVCIYQYLYLGLQYEISQASSGNLFTV